MEECGDSLQKQLDAPTRWIGMYIAAASAVCTLAMAVDIFLGLRNRNLWFPCKYFSLNATFLTLLAVAMKPPMDLSDQLYKDAGYFTKISSLTFMCTTMANFISSLGSMSDGSILSNTIALVILALTIVGNMSIQLVQLRCYFPFPHNTEFFHPTVFIIILLVILVSSAITVQNIKRSLETKYQEMHKGALREDHVVQWREEFTIANQSEAMKKYWVMAETSSPQFVMARLAVSTSSATICWLATFTLGRPFSGVSTWMPVRGFVNSTVETVSAYKWSRRWILATQSIGVLVGLVAPTLRWFNNVTYKYSTMSCKSFGQVFKIENYWTQTLVDWRDTSLAIRIRHDKCRKCFYSAKWLILNMCIGVQILVVVPSKVVVFLSVLLMTPFVVCFTKVRKLLKTRLLPNISNSNDHVGVEIGDETALELNRYVLLLEGEPQLPQTTVKRICHQAENMIQRGMRRQPEDLINFLRKSSNFRGVREFDNVRVESLHSPELPNCWTLPLVTLTTIAIALPNVAKAKAKQLLSCVSEGISFAKLIDEASDTNGELANMRKSADVVFTGIVMHHKWQKRKKILQFLSAKVESVVGEFNREVQDVCMENPLNWPCKVIAANSMYRICQTILLSYAGKNDPTGEELFEKLTVMIADIFAACLTNLPHVISTMCHESAIEKREKSVREAFLLLGKTERIIEVLLHDPEREWPYFDPDFKALSIDEWRASF